MSVEKKEKKKGVWRETNMAEVEVEEAKDTDKYHSDEVWDL